MEMHFYYPNGEKIDTLEDFIDFYNKGYYVGLYRPVEEIIDNILKDGINSELDLLRIIGWKVGAIDMRGTYLRDKSKANSETEILYKTKKGVAVTESEIMEGSGTIISNYGKIIPVVEIAKSIIRKLEKHSNENKCKINNCVIDDEEDFKCFFLKAWKDLFLDIKTEGLGVVYRLTILYFFTRGMLPIYDKFADVAIRAISENKTPLETINYSSKLPKKNKTDSDGICSEYYEYYQKIFLMNDDEGLIERYFKSRDVDRALWTYGHLFTIQT